MSCAICNSNPKSYVMSCPVAKGNICMDHCYTCKWFSGKATWNCTYGWHKSMNDKTEAEKGLAAFRQKMKETKKRALSKRTGPHANKK